MPTENPEKVIPDFPGCIKVFYHLGEEDAICFEG